MEIGLIVGRLLLVITFGVAGVAKLADRAGSRKSMIDFGVPKALAGLFGILLPVAELIVAAALLPAPTAWWGTAGALALLLLFIAGISYNLARGRKPDCHCFGQLHSAPAGWQTLTRNLILAGVAVFILRPGPGYPQPGVWSGLAALSGLQLGLLGGGLALLVMLAVNLWLVVHVLRQNGRLLLRIEAIEERIGIGEISAAPAGLPPGSPAPDFSLGELDGTVCSLAAMRSAGKAVLLLFIEPGCGPCDELLPDVAGWQKSHAGSLAVTVISRGEVQANRAKRAEHGLAGILLQKDGEVADAYQCAGTPGAVIVNSDGTVGSHLALGPEEIRALVRRATLPPPAKKGEKAPEVRLADLAGKAVSLEGFRGRPTIVLFWNPGCGFCQEILDEIKAWERKVSGDAARLLVVSGGTVRDNRAQGFLSPVVLDRDFDAGHAFGAQGTPSAVLVDAAGSIASAVATGATEVIQLFQMTKHE
jgi:peroxiredoxin